MINSGILNPQILSLLATKQGSVPTIDNKIKGVEQEWRAAVAAQKEV